ncbi:DUF1194 domain-containing protein [Glaciecola petra]|uniref:DUF1194 domain-containing protein n=1 Tax=Glaciecola petra TaxID=3075602 RepID=A0ABU2ZSI2_9ALTE|nr:DUF1194 domain-containing protein [Aestuariibacter sp. P117]MDT0595592.1 DUF1194 domain-containing protein [Aestuariibacter sp. P117]
MKSKFMYLIYALAFSIPMNTFAIEEVAVDVELQLLLDVSGSVNSSEYQLQLDGYSHAFGNSSLQQSILSGPIGSIAVQLIMWSGSTQQQVMIDWTLIDSVDSSLDFSNMVASLARPFSGWTAIGEAISYSYTKFDNNDFNGTKKIIDVSGDGTNNSGIDPEVARDIALSNNIDTINGIAISTQKNVEDEFVDNVIGGDDAFLLVTTDFQSFQGSIEKKLIGEVTGVIPNDAIAVSSPNNIVLFVIATFVILFRKNK